MFLLIMAFFAAPINAQTSDGAIITIKTHIYDNVGPGNGCSIALMAKEETVVEVDFGFGRQEYTITADYTTGDDDESPIGTVISGEVSEAGIITVYGDPSQIDYFNASGLYMYEMDITTLTNLEYLIISHNELEALDLTNYTKLQFINVADNPFKNYDFVLGNNHPDLVYLNINQLPSGSMDWDFNVNAFPELVYFTAWANKDISYIDLSNCPKLQYLSLDCAQSMSSVDVSKNPELTVLNISDTGISSIDVSNNPKLRELHCDHQGYDNSGYSRLTSLDIAKNPELVYLFCSGNNLTSLDITNNINLTHVFANDNLLTSIDVSKNENLLQLGISKNLFDFVSLPEQGLTWIEYVFVNQKPMQVEKEQLVGTKLDFSEKVIREGTTTTCALYKVAFDNPTESIALKEGTDYTYVDGKVKLLTEQTDSVYCEFQNSMFDQLFLRSSKFLVKTEENMGKPSKQITFTPNVESEQEISFFVATPGYDKTKVCVDFGDGELKEFETSSEALWGYYPITGTVSNSPVTIYAPEGVTITGFVINNVPLAELDIKQCSQLKVLKATNCQLADVDLTYMKYLSELDLSDNKLTKLNLDGASFYYDKNMSQVIAANNEISYLNLGDFLSNMVVLDLSGNKLTEIDLEGATSLYQLNISNNQISELDIEDCESLSNLYISNNKISRLETYGRMFYTLQYEGNNFSYATMLPQHPYSSQVYAPQSDIVIPKRGLSVDLSAQTTATNIIYDYINYEYVVNKEESVPTTFTWKKEDGSLLVEGEDYTINNGITSFLKDDIGNVYCELTNSAYPNLSGDNILKTTLMETAPIPTNVVATFTPTENATIRLSLAATEDNTFFYADWGNGELQEYCVNSTYALYEGTTTANIPVNFYTFEEDCQINVFSVSDVKLNDIDITKLPNLTCLAINNTGISTIDVSKAPGLTELNLSGNNLTSIDLSNCPNLWMLILSDNKLSELDLKDKSGLAWLHLQNNEFEKFDLTGLSNLSELNLSGNKISEIDLTPCPILYTFACENNQLSEIDFSTNNNLKIVYLAGNLFTFATLPVAKENWMLYTYSDQAPIEIDIDELHQVDISSQKAVDDVNTIYTWYTSASKEALIEGEDYTVAEGVTTFLRAIEEDVYCALTNEVFPNLTLTTNEIKVNISGIESAETDRYIVAVIGNNIVAETGTGNVVEVYNVAGNLVGKAVAVGGKAVFGNLASGIYIVRTTNATYKVIVK